MSLTEHFKDGRDEPIPGITQQEIVAMIRNIRLGVPGMIERRSMEIMRVKPNPRLVLALTTKAAYLNAAMTILEMAEQVET